MLDQFYTGIIISAYYSKEMVARNRSGQIAIKTISEIRMTNNKISTTLLFIITTTVLSSSLFAAKPKPVEVVNTPDVNVTNMPDVNVANTADVNIANVPEVIVTNDSSNPVSVNVENEAFNVQISDEYFVKGDTIALFPGDRFESKELFTVPADKTLIIEYISAFNATVGAPNGQESKLRVSYFDPSDGGEFPGASLVFRTTTSVNDSGGARIFLPVPSDTKVSAAMERADDTVQSTYRVTIAGRLVPASP